MIVVLLCAFTVFFLSIASVNAQENTPAGTTTPTESAVSTETPLKLSFPEAAAHPVSGWRPPLYPIPFALGAHDHFYLDRPIGVDSVNWPLPDYRYGYLESETENPHTGVDIDAPLHTPILAAADGKVVFTGYGLALGAGNKDDPYGMAVVIRHGFSFDNQAILTIYAHMEKITVSFGQYVKAGEQIGNVGVTGNTTGPHVHFEVLLEKNGFYTVQNPELWFAPPIDCGVLVGQFKDSAGNFLIKKDAWIKSESTGENWTISTYASNSVQNDSYYKENLVLSDLEAGKYKVTFYSNYRYYSFEFTISPGAITYLDFTNSQGFQLAELVEPGQSTFISPVSEK